ncbi:lysozyme R [Yersinia phage MHG19]|nr:lysozyme R [Yersinia phage MHG19]
MILQSTEVKWFVGVVEDRMDPLKQGRVRVRVFGVHPYQKVQGDVAGIPTEDLPWMSVLQSTNSAAVSGVGGSITGMVEGTHVYGHWLDRYMTSGLVMGTYSANNATKPNFNEGFSDPTGQYPRYLGSDTNSLNQGGEAGIDSTANYIQDANLDVGINPDDVELSDIPEDPDPNYSINGMLRRDEGLRLKVYWDTEGYPTIGIGHLILASKTRDMSAINKELSNHVNREIKGNPGSITMDEATALFGKDLSKMQADIKKHPRVGPVYIKMNRSRQMALENMAFQLGIGGLAGFKKMLDFMLLSKWKEAYVEARNSLWYSQTKGRASRVSMIILTGNMESYGVPVKKKNLSAMAVAVSAATGGSPSDPWTPEDSRILFKEPPSSYNGQYPYVQTMETEAGHIQEFDNTPGYERYKLVHPTGSYEEVAPDGRRTVKTVGDLFDITAGDGSFLVSGDSKTNVGGNETYYNMSDRRDQIDGNKSIFIRGNDTKTVEGAGTLIVKGNIKIVVEGDADITVMGNCETKVEGDYNMEVGGNMTVSVKGAMNQSVVGSWTQTMQTMSSTASAGYRIDGSRIDLG